MYEVVKVISFCYGHRLINYEGKCKFLHGHNGRAEIELGAGKLDPRGMVADFTDIKRWIGQFIDTELDHRMILCKTDPIVKLLENIKEPIFLLDENPTAENIAKLIYKFAKDKGFPVTSVKLWETDTSFAVYRDI